ncbi:hypothetical protein BFW01_g10320 [Lasiodiplodia theobromae]|uniref:Heterokaryon incompatibility domain-containing protein n=1 Tax=Lasiodiplodia theobromae TaxID=45133 RepID=A0A8H7IPW0_9PEZI|nr:hypothetical protein BFW01_g10320 [Lasiodiplodia theobromae]
MAFSQNSRNIRLDDGLILRAECQDFTGAWKDAEFPLREVLRRRGNALSLDTGTDQDFPIHAWLEGTVLHANMRDVDPSGDLASKSTAIDLNNYLKIDLNNYLKNSNGKLHWVNKAGENGMVFEGGSKEDSKIFQYTPLPNAKSIRLLRLSRFDNEGEFVKCQMETFELGHHPPFAALSYTWGSPFSTASPALQQRYAERIMIQCNGKRFSVQRNLHDALLRLSAPATCNDEPRLVYDKTPLIYYAEVGNLRQVVRLLRGGADVGARDAFGETALHYAAGNGHDDVVKALVLAGSDLRWTNGRGDTPLIGAGHCRHGNYKNVERFLTGWERRHGSPVPQRETGLKRLPAEEEYFWIDAICINQEDSEEKAGQVAMMGEIYKMASSVVIWLGPEREHYADETMEALREIWRLEEARVDEDAMEKLLENPASILEADSKHARVAKEWLDSFFEEAKLNLVQGCNLFKRAWFDRAWTIQEMCMAGHLTVLCGTVVIPWSTFVLAASIVTGFQRWQFGNDGVYRLEENQVPAGWDRMRNLTLAGRFHTEAAVIDMERTRLQLKKHGGKISMISALSLSRNAKATDVRDKVFAITHEGRLIAHGYVFDTVAETATTSLLDVGDQLEGLVSSVLLVIDMVTKSPTERRRALFKAMVEYETTDGDFEPLDNQMLQWILWNSLLEIVDHRTTYVEDGRGDITRTVQPKNGSYCLRPDERRLMLLELLEHIFAHLGIDVERNKMLKEWADPETFRAGSERWSHLYFITASTIPACSSFFRRKSLDSSRRIFRTTGTCVLGTGPNQVTAGDAIFVLEGANVPYLLRQSAPGEYQLVGEAYLSEVDFKDLLCQKQRMEPVCIV